MDILSRIYSTSEKSLEVLNAISAQLKTGGRNEEKSESELALRRMAKLSFVCVIKENWNIVFELSFSNISHVCIL